MSPRDPEIQRVNDDIRTVRDSLQQLVNSIPARLNEKIPLYEEKLQRLRIDMDALERTVEAFGSKYVTNDRYKPFEQVLYGLVGTVLIAILTYALSFILARK